VKKPKQLPKHLRGLPGEWIAKDISDKQGISPYDPPHIVKSLLRMRLRGEAEKLRAQDPFIFGSLIFEAFFMSWRKKEPGRFRVIDQYLVDMFRGKILMKRARQKPFRTSLAYLWFSEAGNANCYELHEGKAPVDAERPEHMKGLHIEVDLLDWPARVRDILRAANVNPEQLIAELKVKADAQSKQAGSAG
jgi:hypothetical protein